MVGNRGASAASELIKDLSERLSNRIQLTTDGHNVYVNAVEQSFGSDIDYAMLIKIYGADVPPGEARYRPAEVISCRAVDIPGKPDPKHVSTSYVERQNLTMRMHMRRFTRLPNAFSKKLEHHIAAISLHFTYYNFGANPSDVECYAGDGRWGHRPHVGHCRYPRTTGTAPRRKGRSQQRAKNLEAVSERISIGFLRRTW